MPHLYLPVIKTVTISGSGIRVQTTIIFSGIPDSALSGRQYRATPFETLREAGSTYLKAVFCIVEQEKCLNFRITATKITDLTYS